MDAFKTSAPVHMMIKKLSENNSKYNLRWVGEALAWGNIHNVRIDFAKPETPVEESSAHKDWAMEKAVCFGKLCNKTNSRTLRRNQLNKNGNK